MDRKQMGVSPKGHGAYLIMVSMVGMGVMVVKKIFEYSF